MLLNGNAQSLLILKIFKHA